MSCTPQILSVTHDQPGGTCAALNLQDATLAQCQALVGTWGAGAPFWHTSDLNAGVSLSTYPFGCWLYPSTSRLYWNSNTGNDGSNDHVVRDVCGCAEDPPTMAEACPAETAQLGDRPIATTRAPLTAWSATRRPRATRRNASTQSTPRRDARAAAPCRAAGRPGRSLRYTTRATTRATSARPTSTRGRAR